MESHETLHAVQNIQETLRRILEVLVEMQDSQQVDCLNIVADKERELLITKALAEATKPKKQPKETNKEDN